jgi:hypothetical protein
MKKRSGRLPGNRTKLYLLAPLYAVPCVLANRTRSGMGEGSATGGKTYNNFPLFFTTIIVCGARIRVMLHAQIPKCGLWPHPIGLVW